LYIYFKVNFLPRYYNNVDRSSICMFLGQPTRKLFPRGYSMPSANWSSVIIPSGKRSDSIGNPFLSMCYFGRVTNSLYESSRGLPVPSDTVAQFSEGCQKYIKHARGLSTKGDKRKTLCITYLWRTYKSDFKIKKQMIVLITSRGLSPSYCMLYPSSHMAHLNLRGQSLFKRPFQDVLFVTKVHLITLLIYARNYVDIYPVICKVTVTQWLSYVRN
jgi:hypothetical protein